MARLAYGESRIARRQHVEAEIAAAAAAAASSAAATWDIYSA